MTAQEAQDQYVQAKEMLNWIARSDEATAAQRDDARAARDELTMNFIGKAVADGNALTAQFQDFTDRMSKVLYDLSEQSTVANSLLKIQDLLRQAERFH